MVDMYSVSESYKSRFETAVWNPMALSGVDALTADEGGGPTYARTDVEAPGRELLSLEQMVVNAKAWLNASHVVGKVQAAYYMLMGLWPLVAPDHFGRTVGLVSELWLAQMLGALVAVAGIVLWQGTAQKAVDGSVALLGVLVAMGLLGAELSFVAGQTATRTLLADGVVQFSFLMGWAAFGLSHRPQLGRPAMEMAASASSGWSLGAQRRLAA